MQNNVLSSINVEGPAVNFNNILQPGCEFTKLFPQILKIFRNFGP